MTYNVLHNFNFRELVIRFGTPCEPYMYSIRSAYANTHTCIFFSEGK